jgi:8-oxo-dGTP pyrophosphatase MutT (NUDIX family)
MEVPAMPRLEFAQKAVVVNHGKVLMLRKSSDDPYYPGRWDLPGGRMKDSEDVDTHLIREVLEETGLVVSPFGRPIHLWSWIMEWHGEPVSVVAVSRYCQLEPSTAVGPKYEIDDYLCEQHWFPLPELLSLDIIPSQLATIERVVKQEPSVILQ